MDYIEKLITERVELIKTQIEKKVITIQTDEENKEELNQLTIALNSFDSLHSVSDCTSTLEDTIDLIEHTSRVLDAYKEKEIAMKVLNKRVKAKLKHLHKLYSR